MTSILWDSCQKCNNNHEKILISNGGNIEDQNPLKVSIKFMKDMKDMKDKG